MLLFLFIKEKVYTLACLNEALEIIAKDIMHKAV